ncbi:MULTISPECIES: ABC transporter ATP-binding protein [Microbacterium]|jgi:ABC-2 type transport system ATP-binding protein|uniref:ATP-binding cassette domain-containing protein n=2 Tax=Microbacterium TaxID=33882 RepID=A0A4Y4B4P9_MICMQ|nr:MULTISPECIES: ATP-binding cassette domain-containing protein [Microbacterium]KAB1886611.1 ATP-binding cassette domain-containing protein [Microbacterium liquefaciens]KQV02000.1 multidrug ABC transporter ATP-binding protein [Microbacterium sp. Root322]KQY77453.1 multidrug ABC transporter ATP-binding protein [Microbacterium sp. Root1433D1]QYG13113.1 ATP-binding cassette domain-containing protein [Microbacterium sp. PAMC22086]WKT89550.1 ATP-binding cassette domain-containing protein [Microbact
MITAEGLTKRFGDKTAVDDVSFTVKPGSVTGFLGPNGAGKSTTMRMIVGLDRPTSGRAAIAGREYRKLRAPLTEVGVLLDAKAVHTGRTARNHLRAMAATHGIPSSRVDEVIDLAGIGSVARKRAGGFSLGMGQRLGIASALLGDPHTLILDEPVNGLDPEGVRWVRQFVRHAASEGRTVLLSSHLMSEMAQTADHVIVMGRGRVLADAPLPELVRSWTRNTVRVRTPRPADLAAAVGGPDVEIVSSAPDLLDIVGLPAARIGDLAADRGIALHELTPTTGSLEDAYLALTGDSVEYRTKEIS